MKLVQQEANQYYRRSYYPYCIRIHQLNNTINKKGGRFRNLLSKNYDQNKVDRSRLIFSIKDGSGMYLGLYVKPLLVGIS
jgi:hypothetical protein